MSDSIPLLGVWVAEAELTRLRAIEAAAKAFMIADQACGMAVDDIRPRTERLLAYKALRRVLGKGA